MKLFLLLLLSLLFFVRPYAASSNNADGEDKMLAKLEKLNKLIDDYKQSSSTNDPLLATKIADLNNIVSNLKSRMRTKRKAKELAKKTQEEEERMIKEKMKLAAETAKEAEKKRKERLQRERETKPTSTSLSASNVLPRLQGIMKRHVEPFLSTIPLPQFVHDMKAFLCDNVFVGLPAQYRPLAIWASIFLLAFLSLVTFIAAVASGRRKRKVQKTNTFDLNQEGSTATMSPAEIQRLQMEKQALESRLKMITSMRSSNNDNTPADEKQKALDEAARQVAQSKLVEYATEAAAARSNLAMVQQQLKTAKEETKMLEEQLFQLKNAGNGHDNDNGNGNGSNETALKDQLMALAKEFNSYKISSQKIIAELHLRISSTKNISSVPIEQITSQQLQQRGVNIDATYPSSISNEGILSSESNDSNNMTSKRSRFVLPPSEPVSMEH